jgi:hypothetical protein
MSVLYSKLDVFEAPKVGVHPRNSLMLMPRRPGLGDLKLEAQFSCLQRAACDIYIYLSCPITFHRL